MNSIVSLCFVINVFGQDAGLLQPPALDMTASIIDENLRQKQLVPLVTCNLLCNHVKVCLGNG